MNMPQYTKEMQDSSIRISKLREDISKAIGEYIGEITVGEILQAFSEEAVFWSRQQVKHDLEESNKDKDPEDTWSEHLHLRALGSDKTVCGLDPNLPNIKYSSMIADVRCPNCIEIATR
jgi:hypothetical protein